jgi:hypothetical protein
VNNAGSLDGGFVPGGGRSEASRQRHAKAQLSMGLASLPEPQYTYEIEVPGVGPENENDDDSAAGGGGRLGGAGGGSAASVEDASDRDARFAKATAEAAQAEFLRRSSSVRKGLPRPCEVVDQKALLAILTAGAKEGGAAAAGDEGNSSAQALVRVEMAALLAHDAAKFPFEPSFGSSSSSGDKKQEAQKKRKRKAAAAAAASGAADSLLTDSFGDAELDAARALVAQELSADAEATAAIETFAAISSGAGAAAAGMEDDDGDAVEERIAKASKAAAAAAAALGSVMAEVQGGFAFLPERSGYGPLASASAKERLSSLQASFEAARGAMAKHAEKCGKLEKKLSVRTKGYEEKAAGLRQEHGKAFGALDKRSIELDCFAMLSATESKALPQRINELYDVSKVAGERNASLQKDYTKLLAERDQLYGMLQAKAAAVEGR